MLLRVVTLFFCIISLPGFAVEKVEGFELYQGLAGQPYANNIEGDVEVTYLGTSGYLIRRASDAILFAPSLTNPGFFALNPVNPISTDKALVDRYLPPVDDVEWLLVGHGHYDHLMDVPYVMQKHATKAVMLASKTAKHAVASELPVERVLVVNPFAASEDKVGEWIYNAKRSMRVLAIASEHSPHFMGIKMMQGVFEEDQKTIPRTSFQWREGQVFNFVVDFLANDGSVVFRLYYQDSTSNAPKGFIPEQYRVDYPRVDLAIYCVAAFEQVRNYPVGHMQNNQPRHILLGHWEDFFANVGAKKQTAMRFTSLDKFVNRVIKNKPADADWMIPDLFSTLYFPLQGD